MIDGLPYGWEISTVGDCFLDIRNGTTVIQNKDGKGIPVTRIETIQNNRFDLSRIRHIENLTIDQIVTFSYRRGDIAFSHINSYEHVGKTALYTDETEILIHGMNLLRLRLGHSQIEPRYVHLFMQSHFFREEVRKRVGHAINQVSINQQKLAEVPLIIPPLSEQKQIVTKINILLTRVNTCLKRLERIPALLKRFRQSVLTAATSGHLTADWREENPGNGIASYIVVQLENFHKAVGGHKRGNAAPPTEEVHDMRVDDLPSGWSMTDLRTAVCPDRPITYGILKPGPNIIDGVKYVRVADFPNDRLDFSNIRRTSKEIDRAYSRARLRHGDILLSIRGTVGRVCIVPDDLEGANITQDTARLSIQPLLSTLFVAWFLRADQTQKRMQKATKGVAVRGINIGDVRALQLPVPPLAEQREIVRRVEALFAVADRIEERYKKAKAHIDKLTQSILSKAFRGELVPQNPNDEPASELLKRIREQRAKMDQPKTKKTRKKA